MNHERNGNGRASSSDARAYWVRRYRASGLALKRFAEEHCLRYGQRREPTSGTEIPEAMQVLQVFQEYFQPWAPAAEWGAEIALADGTRLRVRAGADPGWTGVRSFTHSSSVADGGASMRRTT